MDAPVMLIVALVLTICALVFQIIGLASPYWISYKGFGSANAYSGLWKTCTEIQKTTCTDIADKEGIHFYIYKIAEYTNYTL